MPNLLLIPIPAGTRRRTDVILSLMGRNYVASTLFRRRVPAVGITVNGRVASPGSRHKTLTTDIFLQSPLSNGLFFSLGLGGGEVGVYCFTSYYERLTIEKIDHDIIKK